MTSVAPVHEEEQDVGVKTKSKKAKTATIGGCVPRKPRVTKVLKVHEPMDKPGDLTEPSLVGETSASTPKKPPSGSKMPKQKTPRRGDDDGDDHDDVIHVEAAGNSQTSGKNMSSFLKKLTQ